MRLKLVKLLKVRVMKKWQMIMYLFFLLILSGIIGFVIIGMYNELGAKTGADALFVILSFIMFGYVLRVFMSNLKERGE
jgi:hypothetical protein